MAETNGQSLPDFRHGFAIVLTSTSKMTARIPLPRNPVWSRCLPRANTSSQASCRTRQSTWSGLVSTTECASCLGTSSGFSSYDSRTRGSIVQRMGLAPNLDLTRQAASRMASKPFLYAYEPANLAFEPYHYSTQDGRRLSISWELIARARVNIFFYIVSIKT
jgi:hypothetical protein